MSKNEPKSKPERENRNRLNAYDPLTVKIYSLLVLVPYVGAGVSRLYLWNFMMWNNMAVGATGMVLSFTLYEGILRPLMVNMIAGTLMATLITTFAVFLWNYTLNKRWSLNIASQMIRLKKADLVEVRDRADKLLKKRFDHNGDSM